MPERPSTAVLAATVLTPDRVWGHSRTGKTTSDAPAAGTAATAGVQKAAVVTKARGISCQQVQGGRVCGTVVQLYCNHTVGHDDMHVSLRHIDDMEQTLLRLHDGADTCTDRVHAMRCYSHTENTHLHQLSADVHQTPALPLLHSRQHE